MCIQISEITNMQIVGILSIYSNFIQNVENLMLNLSKTYSQ